MLCGLPYFPRISFVLNAFEDGIIRIQSEIPYDKSLRMNRMIIPGSNGLINLSIPILGGRNNRTRIIEIKIDNSYHWQRDHYRSIASVYGRSPFFVFYADELKELYEVRIESLLEWNILCFNWILKKFK